MIEKGILWSLRNRGIVLFSTVITVALSVFLMLRTPLDAIPDISDTQVLIEVDWEGQDPTTIEDQITYPMVSRLLSVPRVKNVRGISMQNKALIYAIFEEGTGIYWARSRVLEYISGIELPEGAKVELGPPATSLGWIFMYALVDRTGKFDLASLRAFNDFYLRYRLLKAKGVADVVSVGGYVKEYQIDVDPYKIRAYGITFEEVINAVKSANLQRGGRFLEVSERYYTVRGVGYIRSVEDIKSAVLKVDPKTGANIKIGDVAFVQIGPALKEGAVDLDGKGEVVGGIVIMRDGENVLRVIGELKEIIRKIELPEGVELVITYDRSELVKEAIETTLKTLIKEILIVLVVVAIFLMNIRGSIPIILFLPTALVLPYIFIYLFKITTNIMSLAGMILSVGVMIDAGVVMVENVFKKLEERYPRSFEERFKLIYGGVSEVAPSLFFSLAIITVSFLPVFYLRGEEGKLFFPLAFTKTLTMLFATFLSVTLVPVLILTFFPSRVSGEEDNPINTFLKRTYGKIFELSVNKPYPFILSLFLLPIFSLLILRKIPSEFMPNLNEGAILYMPSTLPGIPLDEGVEVLRKQDSIIKSFPEVERVFGKIGRAETPTDPAPLSMIETVILLKPKGQWRKGMDLDSLIKELNSALNFPGWINTWGMPIRVRIDMLKTGIRTPLGIKVLGDDPFKTESLALEIEGLLKNSEGILNAFAERSARSPYINIIPKREKLAEYGLSVMDIMEILEKIVGGSPLDRSVEGRERYSIRVRLARAFRDEIEDLKNLEIITPSGAITTLGNVADVVVSEAPSEIRDEDGFVASFVYIIPKEGADLGKVVEEAKEKLKILTLPRGYFLEFSGQYEDIKRVRESLMFILPITILTILFLLYLNFRSLLKSVIVLLGIPFTLFGAFGLMYLLNYKMSVASWVGIIALLGISAEMSVVMLLFMDIGLKNHPHNPLVGIREGALNRLRPKVMTTLTTFTSLIPAMFEAGIGSEVIKRITAPMVGGIFFALILTLVIYPAIYSVIYGRKG